MMDRFVVKSLKFSSTEDLNELQFRVVDSRSATEDRNVNME